MSNPRDMRQFVLSMLAAAMNLFATQNVPAGLAANSEILREQALLGALRVAMKMAGGCAM